MAFQKFTESGKGFRPRISIRKSGSMGINEAAVKRFSLDETGFLALYFDEDTDEIALGVCSAEDAGAHKLHRGPAGASVSARRFLDFHGISSNQTELFDCHILADEKLIVLKRRIRTKKERTNDPLDETTSA